MCRDHRTGSYFPRGQLSVSLLPRWHWAHSPRHLPPTRPGCMRGSHPATPPSTPLCTQPPATPPPLPPNKPAALDELANLHDSHAEVQETGGEKTRGWGVWVLPPFFLFYFCSPFLSSPLPRPSFPSLHRRTLK